jgi:hypothetical protein
MVTEERWSCKKKNIPLLSRQTLVRLKPQKKKTYKKHTALENLPIVHGNHPSKP